MNVEILATAVIDACEAEGVEHMLTGAFASSVYGIPRSTKHVDLVLSLTDSDPISQIEPRLSPIVEFNQQFQFDTLTWGRRVVGKARKGLARVELFALFDDPFVLEQFSRRKRTFFRSLQRQTWLPTPEDIIVQKLRWGRPKDLQDARDIVVVQGLAALDRGYIEGWCARHATENLWKAASAE